MKGRINIISHHLDTGDICELRSFDPSRLYMPGIDNSNFIHTTISRALSEGRTEVITVWSDLYDREETQRRLMSRDIVNIPGLISFVAVQYNESDFS